MSQPYPIAGTTWAVLYVNQKGAGAKELPEFLTWVLTDGQNQSEAMHYAPLPEELAKLAIEKVKSVQ